MKKTVNEGLNGLLNSVAPVPQEPEQKPEKIKGNYKTVCFSLPPEIVEKIRYIAYYDRRKVNAVVTEAFEQYAAKWQPKQEKPKKL